jgi:hypothetical protein
MVDFQMPISTAHQRIIASEFIGINNQTAAYGFDGEIKLRGSTTAAFAFSFAAKIGFIDLNFAIQKLLVIGTVGNNGHTNHMGCFKSCWIAQIQLLGDLFGRYLKLKEFDDPQPMLAAYAKTVYPAPG